LGTGLTRLTACVLVACVALLAAGPPPSSAGAAPDALRLVELAAKAGSMLFFKAQAACVYSES
jgi:hypothetical protein